ncbi:hypothetical protein [Nocardiopsis sp. NPDC006832]|uniref:hypothetical protein n=1 Tax=Nocardiopsis sp. NPDC006832 TaxID=3157188 RepID=UPI0033E2ABAA
MTAEPTGSEHDPPPERRQAQPTEEGGAKDAKTTGERPSETKGDATKKGRRRPRFGNKVDKNRGQAVAAGKINGGVHYHEHIGEGITQRLRQTATVDEERVKEVRNTFCAADPAAYDIFRNELRDDGVGVVSGKPGTGRFTAALHALASVRLGSPIEELTIDTAAKDAGVSLINVDSDESLLLDLTGLPEPTTTQKVALRGLAMGARRSGALLVFVSDSVSRGFPNDLRARLRIDAPAGAIDVFRRVMGRICGERATALWLDTAEVREALEGAEPARVITLVREAHRRKNSFTDEKEWIAHVLKDHVENSDDLAGWFREHALDTEFQRVLLATVALLEGGPRAAIAHHARGLAKVWHVPPLWRTPISGDGLTSHLGEIKAHVREDGIYFNRPKAADEALDYLWREHPETRTLLREWVPVAVADLGEHHRLEAARRWLRLARRQRDFAPVRMLIEEWGNTKELMWEAIPVVAEAALSPEFGPRVRRLLYNIASSPRVRMSDRTVLEVCRVYGRIQPETALTRIRAIAEKVLVFWDPSLVQALEDIAGEPENTGVVLESLVDWTFRERKGRANEVAALALCRLLARGGKAGPRVLVDLWSGERTSDELARAWQAATSSEAEVGRALWAWFDALADCRDASDIGFEVLRGVAREHGPFRSALERWINRWRHAHTHRAPAIEELWRIITEERK